MNLNERLIYRTNICCAFNLRRFFFRISKFTKEERNSFFQNGMELYYLQHIFLLEKTQIQAKLN